MPRWNSGPGTNPTSAVRVHPPHLRLDNQSKPDRHKPRLNKNTPKQEKHPIAARKHPIAGICAKTATAKAWIRC